MDILLLRGDLEVFVGRELLVSILILMDILLLRPVPYRLATAQQVSILILMDILLLQVKKNSISKMDIDVSILILMDILLLQDI